MIRQIFRKHRYVYFVLLAFFLSFSACSGGGVVATSTTVVAFSDVHFDPFYDTSIFDQLVAASVDEWEDVFSQSEVTDLSTWGEESNYPLLKQSLQKACDEAENASFVIFNGDILTHSFSSKFYSLYGSEDETAMREFLLKSVSYFSHRFREYCGSVPILMVLGNNDAYEGDYLIMPNSEFLEDTSDLFYSTLLMEKADQTSFESTYKYGGYYSTDLLNTNLRVIVLNSVFFSTRAASGTEGAASVELSWLEEELSDARENGRKAWIILHIPPGADIYSSISHYMDESGHLSDAMMMLKTDYQDSLTEIFTDNADVITGIFAGHTHMDEFRLSVENDANSNGSVIVTPGITPFFGNNSAFKVVSVSLDSWEPTGYVSIYNDLSLETQLFEDYYDFADSFGLDAILDTAFLQLYEDLSTDEDQKEKYIEHYYSGHDDSNPINSIKWQAYRCGIDSMNKTDYIECVNSD